MSYDLYFYTEKNGNLSLGTIEKYLSEKLGPVNDTGQWFYENEDTGVYFLFERYDPHDENEDISESFDDTRALGLSFNLNLIRPDFFGLEAVEFVDRLIAEFDLYVFDFQGDPPEPPYKPNSGQMYQQWSSINTRVRDLIPKDAALFCCH